MKPTITPTQTYTVEGLSNLHCVLLYTLLSSYKESVIDPYAIAALELVEMLEGLDLYIGSNSNLIASSDDVSVFEDHETSEFKLEIR